MGFFIESITTIYEFYELYDAIWCSGIWWGVSIWVAYNTKYVRCELCITIASLGTTYIVSVMLAPCYLEGVGYVVRHS